jgi:hypothetical protein
MAGSPNFPYTTYSVPIQLSHASSTTTPTTIVAAQANGCLIGGLITSNTDNTNAYALGLYSSSGGSNFLIATINIPANSGNAAGTAAIDMINGQSTNLPHLQVDAFGNNYMILDATTSLSVLPTSAISSPKLINIMPQIGAF